MRQEKNYQQVTTEAKELFRAFFATLGLKTDVFFEIVESLGSNDIYLNLSYDSLIKYQYNPPIKYLSGDYRKLVRTIKRAVSIYIGIDVEDYSDASDGTPVLERSKYNITVQLPEEHIKQVEVAWRKNKTSLMDQLFQIHERVRAIECSESEYQQIKAEADRADHFLKFFDKLNCLSPEEITYMSPMCLDSPTVAALVWLIQENPQVIASVQKIYDNIVQKYVKTVMSDQK